ncbi:enoyl-CoA hydratase/isomerase family protein [Pseudonocardia sp. C8]|uniref:enoyl-CoA hydratase-related protein n=1 Tax=Pseudonocardia sp. C8 TaxID=2762759 RepID=UPI00164256B6|nr:enoyl-CoA hydratase-related protein [Pseudonocardia sp. C8]MBC3193579.1 enoyl-CoA hydratase/isomerase family protein [Pseudonocardia sp. C8]
MGEDVLLTRRDGGVLTLTLNRPRRKNAVDAALWGALRDQLTVARDDADVRAVVLTGAGGAFCAGADLSGGVSAGHPLDRMRRVNEVALLLHELPVPSIAQVDGVAVGAGWNLALGCDLVVATPAARFSQIFARRGLSLDFGGSWLLPRLVGMQQAKRLALLAETIDAAEAHRLGLVTWVVDAAGIDGFVADLGARLAAAAPVAVAQSKALLHENADRTMREALASEARTQAVNFATADAPAAFAAFNEKREPEFTGEWAVR